MPTTLYYCLKPKVNLRPTIEFDPSVSPGFIFVDDRIARYKKYVSIWQVNKKFRLIPKSFFNYLNILKFSPVFVKTLILPSAQIETAIGSTWNIFFKWLCENSICVESIFF